MTDFFNPFTLDMSPHPPRVANPCSLSVPSFRIASVRVSPGKIASSVCFFLGWPNVCVQRKLDLFPAAAAENLVGYRSDNRRDEASTDGGVLRLVLVYWAHLTFRFISQSCHFYLVFLLCLTKMGVNFRHSFFGMSVFFFFFFFCVHAESLSFHRIITAV